MENATTTARRRALASASGIVLGLVLAACEADHQAGAAAAPEPVEAVQDTAVAPEPALPPPSPRAAAVTARPVVPTQAHTTMGAIPSPRTPLSMSDPDATADQVWGEVIGGNAGAAESCGAAAERVAAYREHAQRYVVMRHMKTTLPDDYLQAYERARQSAAAIARGPGECARILAALDG